MKYTSPLLFMMNMYGISSAKEHSTDDYSNKFLSDVVWTAPYQERSDDYAAYYDDYAYYDDANYIDVKARTIEPYKQTAEPFNITYRFADYIFNKYDFTHGQDYGCNIPFTEEMKRITRNILHEDLQNNILPGHIGFQEVDSNTKANINYIMCNNLLSGDAFGSADYPLDFGSDVLIDRSLSIPNIADIFDADESLKQFAIKLTNYIFGKTNEFKYVISHETGHAMGLRHTQNEGVEANIELETGYTARSSIMSYESNLCELNYIFDPKLYVPSHMWQYLTWEKYPEIRTSYGPVDEINLKYAYNPDAPSIRHDQTDGTFPCNAKTPEILGSSSLPAGSRPQINMGSSYPVPEILAGIGFGIAVFCALRKHGYAKEIYAADKAEELLNNITSSREDNATTSQAFRNAAKDVLPMAIRVGFPVTALVHDLTYNVLDEALKDSRLDKKAYNMVGVALTCIASNLAYRIIGLPLYGAYDNTEPNNSSRLSSKRLARNVTNLRVARHFVPDYVYSWANSITPKTNNNSSQTEAISSQDGDSQTGEEALPLLIKRHEGQPSFAEKIGSIKQPDEMMRLMEEGRIEPIDNTDTSNTQRNSDSESRITPTFTNRIGGVKNFYERVRSGEELCI